MERHIAEVRRIARQSLRALAVFGGIVTCIAAPLRADDAVPIALHLTPGTYERSDQLVHVVSFDMSKTLKSMAGGRADDKTVLESRVDVYTVRAGNAVSEVETNTRRFGGEHPKDTSTKERTSQWQGTIAPNGTRTPPVDVLEDAGDGALDQLPEIPLAVGQQWTFSRPVKTERDLGSGNMTYVDKVIRLDQRGGHRIAIIAVTGVGLITPPKDMQDHGFKESTMNLSGTAEFDTTTGLPGLQHYTGKVSWSTRIMFNKIGVVFEDTYDATPLTPKQPGSSAAASSAQTSAGGVPSPIPTRTKPPY